MDRRERFRRYGHALKTLPNVEINLDRRIATFSFEDSEKVHTLRLKWEVCGTCDGAGRHVNPNIDSHGLSSEDFDDEDFREGYFSGRYDVTCYECEGRTTSLCVDRDATNAESLSAADEYWQEDYSYQYICEAERRMGA